MVSVILALALLGGGGAYGVYRYDAAAAERLLPGIAIAGIDVGEMTRAEAVAAVREVADAELDREIEVTAGGRSWHVTPRELGTRARVKAAVNRALAVSEDLSWPARAYRRMFDSSVDRSFGLEYRHREKRVQRFVDTVNGAVSVSPTDASVNFVGGELVLEKPKRGRELRAKEAQAAVMGALTASGDAVKLGIRILKPSVTTEDLGYTIVVSLSDLKLYLYEGLDRVKAYPVAAGEAQYPTPPGDWTIINKAENPTWVNPAPDGWGASLPAVIPGGPGNPLGTRALYLDAPGIRIHGTADSGSIGSYASHGCIRMHRADVEELYEIVPIGTPVHVVQ